MSNTTIIAKSIRSKYIDYGAIKFALAGIFIGLAWISFIFFIKVSALFAAVAIFFALSFVVTIFSNYFGNRMEKVLNKNTNFNKCDKNDRIAILNEVIKKEYDWDSFASGLRKNTQRFILDLLTSKNNDDKIMAQDFIADGLRRFYGITSPQSINNTSSETISSGEYNFFESLCKSRNNSDVKLVVENVLANTDARERNKMLDQVSTMFFADNRVREEFTQVYTDTLYANQLIMMKA